MAVLTKRWDERLVRGLIPVAGLLLLSACGMVAVSKGNPKENSEYDTKADTKAGTGRSTEKVARRAAVLPVAPLKAVDLDRYLGRWYEFARYENRFERGCDEVTADYSLRSDGKVTVVNSCLDAGQLRIARGKAKVVPDSRNAKLRVSFFGPFYADYWILDHADDYSWSIVGEPSRKYLWILTRDQNVSPRAAASLIERARGFGYDMSKLRRTAQDQPRLPVD